MSILIGHEVAIIRAITSQTIASATSVDSAWIDTSGYVGDLLINLNCSAGSTGDTLNVTVKENTASSGSGTAVPASVLYNPATGLADTFDQVDDTGSSFQTLAIKLDRLAQYIQVTVTTAGTGVSITVSVQLVATKKYVG